jgi:hypothetical protein
MGLAQGLFFHICDEANYLYIHPNVGFFFINFLAACSLENPGTLADQKLPGGACKANLHARVIFC